MDQPRKRKLSEDEEEVETDEDEGLDEEEDSDLIQQRAYERLLPRVIEALGDEAPNLSKDTTFRTCLVCPTLHSFKGLQALIKHAETIRTKRVPQHRGYHRALLEAISPTAALKRENIDLSKAGVPQKPGEEPGELETGIISPPIIIVRSSKPVDEVQKFVFGICDPGSVEKIAQAGDGGEFLVVFKESASLQSEALVNHGGARASAGGMMKLDPCKKLVEWRVAESSSAAAANSIRAAIMEAQETTAAYYNQKLRLVELEKKKELLENCRDMLETQVLDAKKDIDDCCDQAETIVTGYKRELKEEQARFMKDLRSIERESIDKQKSLRHQIETTHQKLEKQKLEELKQIKQLEKIYRSETGCQKPLSEVLGTDEMNLKLQQVEAELVAQKQEIKKLEEALKNEEQKALEHKLVEQECSVCWFIFSEVERAVFRPCGHANVCIGCAREIFIKKRVCPSCRLDLTDEPIPFPKMFEALALGRT